MITWIGIGLFNAKMNRIRVDVETEMIKKKHINRMKPAVNAASLVVDFLPQPSDPTNNTWPLWNKNNDKTETMYLQSNRLNLQIFF